MSVHKYTLGLSLATWVGRESMSYRNLLHVQEWGSRVQWMLMDPDKVYFEKGKSPS